LLTHGDSRTPDPIWMQHDAFLTGRAWILGPS